MEVLKLIFTNTETKKKWKINKVDFHHHSLVGTSLPARSDSNSPADIITGSTPMAWKISSVWKDLPCPFPPQMPAQMYHSLNNFDFKNYVNWDTTIWSHTNLLLQRLAPSSYPCQHETRMANGGSNIYHIDMPEKHTCKCDDRRVSCFSSWKTGRNPLFV